MSVELAFCKPNSRHSAWRVGSDYRVSIKSEAGRDGCVMYSCLLFLDIMPYTFTDCDEVCESRMSVGQGCIPVLVLALHSRDCYSHLTGSINPH